MKSLLTLVSVAIAVAWPCQSGAQAPRSTSTGEAGPASAPVATPVPAPVAMPATPLPPAPATPPAPGASIAPSAARSAELELYVGQARVLDAGNVRRIVIGNGRVIQATALDDGQVLVIPEAPGQSTLHLWGRDGREAGYVVTVVPADSARLLAEVRAMLGAAPNLSARIVGDKIVVEGGNLSEEQASRLTEVAKRYPQIVNLVSRIGFERMIALDVRMVEIRRDRLEHIGVRWNGSMTGPAFTIAGDLHRSNALRPGGAAEGIPGVEVRPRIEPFATAFGIASTVTSMIDLMVQNGDAVVLAEPSLSCRSGGSAKFLAGGELPIPYSSGLGSVSVVFKEYGVKFDINPLASETGVIAAKIATEISSINFDVMVRDVPGITKRRAETEVNLREHETLVIAGLIAEESSRSIDRVPALGELPVLGNLFRSRAFRERQSELVVFITPRFVDPFPAGAPVAAGWPVSPLPPPAGSASPVPLAAPSQTAAQSASQVSTPMSRSTTTTTATQAPTQGPTRSESLVSTPPPSEGPWPLSSPPPSSTQANAAPGTAQPSPAVAAPPVPPAQRFTPAAMDRRKQEARERVRMLE